MGKIIDFRRRKNRKKEKKSENDGNEQCAEKARERDAGWQVFAKTVRHLKNGGLTGKQALTVFNLLSKHFGIKAGEIKIDALIRAEFAGHIPNQDCLSESGDGVIFALTCALQENLIDRQQALRIVRVITVWHRIDLIEKK